MIAFLELACVHSMLANDHVLVCQHAVSSDLGLVFTFTSSQNRPDPTLTSRAHSLNCSNDPSITQTLTLVPPPPRQPSLWSAASDAVGQVLRPGNRATGFPLFPPFSTSACTGVPAPPGQPGPRSVPTRLQPLTAPTQNSGSNAEDLLAPWRREIRRICRGNLHARKSKSNLTKSEEIGDLSDQGSARLKKAEAMGQLRVGYGRGGLHLNCQQSAAQVTFTLTASPTTVPALHCATHCLVADYILLIPARH